MLTRILPEDDLSACITEEKSSAGRGGMTSKCATARQVAAAGIRVAVANGRHEGILLDLVDRPEAIVHTEFVPVSPKNKKK